jgi:putative membrane protein
MRTLRSIAFLAGVGMVLTLSATAQADKAKNDNEWLQRAMLNGKAEVKFSEIAVQRGSSVKVKAFAEKMVKEHKQCGEKLAEAARNLSVPAVADFDRDQTGTIDGLKRLSGADFDRAYIRRMVQDHEKTVKSFENEAKSGTNADLKKIANDALPHLQEHLKEAREIANELNK